ncbi:hypothetical protein [Hydrogenophaga sp. BPS33]|uniref:hypothetical protein n=1 Tax=Hydrogenophaga sp. BPS33 TaxID=2651974 RepID=UPI00131FDC48|nr:hypothetical protein [Hydrogenophaga sp. BPS33]QHE83965.1 hypothetical protein F9K07_03225 [Hydrogenophaga sp. BPS33]
MKPGTNTPALPQLSPRSAAIQKDINDLKALAVNERGIFSGKINVAANEYFNLSYSGPNLYAMPSSAKRYSNQGERDLEVLRHLTEQALDFRDAAVAELANEAPNFERVKGFAEALLELEQRGVSLDELKFTMGDGKIRKNEYRYDGNDIKKLQAHLARWAHAHVTELIDGKTKTSISPELFGVLNRFQVGLAPTDNKRDSSTTIDEFILGLLPTKAEVEAGVAPLIVKQQREVFLGDSAPPLTPRGRGKADAATTGATVRTPGEKPEPAPDSTVAKPARGEPPKPDGAGWKRGSVRLDQSHGQAVLSDTTAVKPARGAPPKPNASGWTLGSVKHDQPHGQAILPTTNAHLYNAGAAAPAKGSDAVSQQMQNAMNQSGTPKKPNNT